MYLLLLNFDLSSTYLSHFDTQTKYGNFDISLLYLCNSCFKIFKVLLILSSISIKNIISFTLFMCCKNLFPKPLPKCAFSIIPGKSAITHSLFDLYFNTPN